MPRLGIVNGHPSLLPRYRGPFPSAWAVRNGETEIGLTYHLMDAAFDTGNILAQKSIPLDRRTTPRRRSCAKFDGCRRRAAADGLRRGSQAATAAIPQEGGEYQSMFEPEYCDDRPVAGRPPSVHRQVRAWSFMPPIAS